MKVCSSCGTNKKNKEFYKGHNKCKVCAKKYQLDYSLRKRESPIENVSTQLVPVVTTDEYPEDPKDSKEIAMKRMLAGAKSRAKDKGLMFNLHYDDVQIPNLCPILKIPLIPSQGMSDGSPSLDRMVPYLGYTKGNVKVISMLANRVKTNATSAQIAAVLEYVRSIEEDNT